MVTKLDWWHNVSIDELGHGKNGSNDEMDLIVKQIQ